jgi:hypothetical protein
MLDAAISLMSSDMASMQAFDPERNQLRLVAWKGFHPQSAAFWECVHLDAASTCGMAFSSGCRVVAADVETCDFMAGTADLDEYRRSNIRAVQSTPLVSRSGELLQCTGASRINPLIVPCSDWTFLLDKLPILLNRTEAALRNEAATVLVNTPFLLTRCSSDLRYLFISEACARMLAVAPKK